MYLKNKSFVTLQMSLLSLLIHLMHPCFFKTNSYWSLRMIVLYICQWNTFNDLLSLASDWLSSWICDKLSWWMKMVLWVSGRGQLRAAELCTDWKVLIWEKDGIWTQFKEYVCIDLLLDIIEFVLNVCPFFWLCDALSGTLILFHHLFFTHYSH